MTYSTETTVTVPEQVPGHEPQILAFCSCGWESPVYAKGAAAEIKWMLHVRECTEAGDSA